MITLTEYSFPFNKACPRLMELDNRWKYYPTDNVINDHIKRCPLYLDDFDYGHSQDALKKIWFQWAFAINNCT